MENFMSATDADDLLSPNAGKQRRRGEDHPGVAEMIATPRGTGYTE